MMVPCGMNSSAKIPIPWIALCAIRVFTRSMRQLYATPPAKRSLCVQRSRRILPAGGAGGGVDAHALQHRQQEERAAEEQEQYPEVVGEGQELGLPRDLLVQHAHGPALGGEMVGALGGEV